jgi:uncharacterized protein (DUF58 family)
LIEATFAPPPTAPAVASRHALVPTPRLAAWFMVASLGLLVEAVIPGASLATVAALGALLALVARDARSVRAALQLEVQRRRDAVLSNGAANPVRLSVYNPTEVDLDLQIVDEPPPEFALDRETFALRLPAGAAWEDLYHVTPDRRGDYSFGALNLRARSALGLLSLERAFDFDDRAVRVYPDLRAVKGMTMLAMRDQVLRMGIRTQRAPFVGREFESLRDYQSGDEWRSLDWKATARRQRLTVRSYDVEHSQKILLVLDLGRTMSTRMGELSKADVAINASVLLTAVASRLDDRVGLLAFADRVIGWLPPVRGKGQAGRLLDFLYPLEAVTRESDYRAAFHEIALRVRGRTLVVVFTDLVDPESSSQLIHQLGVLAAHHAVLCVALSDHELEDVQAHPPADPDTLWRQTVAASLLDDREQAIAKLQERGVRVMKARPDSLSVDLVNRYLGWKRMGRL